MLDVSCKVAFSTADDDRREMKSSSYLNMILEIDSNIIINRCSFLTRDNDRSNDILEIFTRPRHIHQCNDE